MLYTWVAAELNIFYKSQTGPIGCHRNESLTTERCLAEMAKRKAWILFDKRPVGLEHYLLLS